MSRIVPQILTLSQHLISLAEAPQIYRPARCPSCGLGGRLWGHGSYERKANRDRDPGVPDFLPIPRFYCRHCGKTCSRLPPVFDMILAKRPKTATPALGALRNFNGLRDF